MVTVMRRPIPKATVARLPIYLQALLRHAADDPTISSEHLGALTNVGAAKVRKDLSYLGSEGVRGVGYDVAHLRSRIERELGLTRDYPVVIVGVGNLGSALANYRGFAERGFVIAGLYDTDRDKVGRRVDGLSIRHIDQLVEDARRLDVAIAIIATPGHAAQEVADRLDQAGIRSILNFAPATIRVPEGVVVRQVDLSTELQILSYYLQRGG
jgi:redox-sensing transcriptional repressor